MSRPRLLTLGICAILAAPASMTMTLTARAADLSAVTGKSELMSVDSASGATTLIGPYVLPKGELGISHIARHANGNLYGLSASTSLGNVYVLDDTSATATQVQSAGGPVSGSGAAIDPTDGSFWFLNTFGITGWASLARMDLSTGALSFPGLIGPTGDDFMGLAFDASGQLYTLNHTMNALWKVDKTDPSNNSVIVGTNVGKPVDLSLGATLSRDPQTGVIFGHAVAGNMLFTLDTFTGAGTVVTPTTPLPLPLLAIAAGKNSLCGGSAVSYGTGCAGSGGLVPSLTWSGCAEVGKLVSLTIADGLGGATAVLFFGANQGSLPVGGGCRLLVSPVLAAAGVTLSGSGPGNGNISIVGVIPPNAAGSKTTLQAFVIDPANPIGGAGTNGVEVSVP